MNETHERYGVLRSYPSTEGHWAIAERFADEYGGDTGIPVDIVEDFTDNVLLVMPDEKAGQYVLEFDAEIQYGPTPFTE